MSSTRIDVAMEFSDLANDGDNHTLYIPTAGDFVLILIRLDSYVPWTGGSVDVAASDYIALGRNATSDDYQAFLGDIAEDYTGDAFGAAGDGYRRFGADYVNVAGDYCPDTTPIRAHAVFNGHGPATSGHVDLSIIVLTV